MTGGRLAGRVCVVTGAAGGLGADCVRRFVDEGATVVAVDRVAAPFDDPRVLSETGDAADSATIAAIASRHPSADILVAHAAISHGGGVLDTSPEVWAEVLRVNVTAIGLWVRALLPAMQRSGRGSVVTVASQLALAGGRGNASYLASKGAVMALTRTIALEHASDGVRANCLVPGAINTGLLKRSFARQSDPRAAEAASLARHPLGRFGRPEEVSAAALFLASPESSFTTGALLPVDGGWLAA